MTGGRKMSLLDEAKSEKAEAQAGPKFCKMARQVAEELPVDEFRELMRAGMYSNPDREVEPIFVYRVLKAHGIQISDNAITDRLKNGCRCQWCRENWMDK
jgi:hypothetical protein